jgi:hypothetical protein
MPTAALPISAFSAISAKHLTVECTLWVGQQNPGQMVDHWSCL